MRSYCGEGTGHSRGGAVGGPRSMCTAALGLPRRPVRTVSLGAAPSKARAAHLGVVDAAAPTTPLSSARPTYGGAARKARRGQTVGEGGGRCRYFRGFF